MRSREAGGTWLPSAEGLHKGFARRRVTERGLTDLGHGRCWCTTLDQSADDLQWRI